MRCYKLPGSDVAGIEPVAARDGHFSGLAKGWGVTARFGPGGIRWPGAGPCLRVVALNPQRGTGTTTRARFEFLRRALATVGTDGRTVFLTAAGFFGCVAPPGDSLNLL